MPRVNKSGRTERPLAGCQEVDRFVSHFVHVTAPNGKLRFLNVL